MAIREIFLCHVRLDDLRLYLGVEEGAMSTEVGSTDRDWLMTLKFSILIHLPTLDMKVKSNMNQSQMSCD